MTILGCFEEGLTGSFQTLALKATLDGFTAALLASTMGWGVLLRGYGPALPGRADARSGLASGPANGSDDR